ncbi:hypothetical protein A2627_03545 [Candidatus Woesebacteria bacterium RIFCSPHIGHO2_01_FULL_39_28]|uniref:PEGA domain-containing protein n=1 Tax=Candidatus Woesebacteria bacterium RIFCSPHIGHO2_01_FULL_39_28 TaxID=1802496 RepID=A0A1F7YB89_9BACT|nr:MAG: hypothetical protein A2627_03545 [Candidatus Woesebacteria bacterium RIFCSPHIGHO2_01_FULL_39_28]OGM57421.1 MAG: hypothetical protein A3A50_05820 [Candidatus Woesebacteria bacterium RIFCSPLOWO2_01_FULL_38_20]
MIKIRVAIFFITLLVVGTIGLIASYYARGYRLNFKTFHFVPNGLFVVNSEPNGAQVFIDGELKTATNSTLPLPPGTYDVLIKKEGFISWSKRLVIEKEIVTQVDAVIFPTAPSLSAITFSGAYNPKPSSDLTRIAYGILPSFDNDKAGLWIIEAVDLPLGFKRESRQITDGDLTDATWDWSPDSREILLTTKTGVYLLDSGSYTAQNKRVNVSPKLDEIKKEWTDLKNKKLEAQLSRLPDETKDIFERKVKEAVFSPDENKILYTASGSATIPLGLIKPLPGSSTQKQERDIKTNRIYAYDIKEDRNFLITDTDNQIINWFPTSAHLVLAEPNKITIIDYDGTNRQVVYSGQYEAPHAYPSANQNRLIILTNLGANSSIPNLYSLSLK